MKILGFCKVSVVVELVLVLYWLLCDAIEAKECTNIPTQLSSHTIRYELLASKNESLRQEMFAHYHLNPTDDLTWSSLLPRKILREEDEFDWAMMYRKMKNDGGFKMGGEFLKEVSLHDVRLDWDSVHGRAQKTNLDYLLMLDVDSLVWSFRKTAGLETPGNAYGGWEHPKVELRGHFVGHYMSASAQMWASAHNETLNEKMSAVVSALAACQEKIGTGYLSAFPSELFDRFEAIQPVWAPYYTLHKILAGLLDQYTLAGNDQALKMATWMVEYFYNRVQNVISKHSIERHWLSLNEETGGMNDALYKLYSITGDPKHLLLAHLFDKPCFLGLLAVQADDISGFHANTHIPIVIGSQMRYEITGDPLYKAVGTFFMDIVNSSHSYATGGTSSSEFWSDPKRLASTLHTETEESCTTYNMLKVSRHLFRWTKEMAYADYYERALTNGVLGIQRGTDPGIMIYMLPLGRGVSKAKSYHGWGTQFNSFWCCYGTGIESFSKLGDSIYFEEEGTVPGLYITQYISSSLNWRNGKVLIHQEVDPVTSWDPYLRVTLKFSSKEGVGELSTLNLRIPSWSYSNDAKAALNGQILHVPSSGNVLSVTRKWSDADIVTLEFPLSLRTETIKDDRPEFASVKAILYGPYLLAGLTTGDWDIKTDSSTLPSDWATPVPKSYHSNLISLSKNVGNSTFVLTNKNFSITMEKKPEPGTDSSMHATFRLIFDQQQSSSSFSPKYAIGKQVMLEPFNFPGLLVAHQGKDEDLGFSDGVGYSVFNLVAGLDGNADTISLESQTHKGCYVYTGTYYNSSASVKLSCLSSSWDESDSRAASFLLNNGIAEYHPISFVAKGVNRNFILSPLQSLVDESYTAYFNLND